jgi:quercetin 2,3-dioxygenase
MNLVRAARSGGALRGALAVVAVMILAEGGMGEGVAENERSGKGVAMKISASREEVGEGLTVLRALPGPGLEAVGPFVFLDQMGPAAPPPGGVPAHPHAGIEVITYLLEGENEHRDSFGNRSAILPGGAQWIVSGSGMLHAEFPRAGASGVMHGVQLWVRQAAALDEQPPRYVAVAPQDCPVADVEGARLRLLAGSMPIFFKAPGPLRLSVAADLAHITLAPGASTTLPLRKSHEAAVYALAGEGAVEGEALSKGELALLLPASTVTLANHGAEPLEALLLGGEPAPRPLFFRGPFVFNSRQRIERAFADYAAGRMGRLDGAPF